MLSHLFPALSISFGRWLAVTLVAVLMLEAALSVNEHFVHVVWAAFLSLAINPMLGFAIFSSNHIVLLPAFVLVIALAWERWVNRRALVSIFLLSLLVVLFYGIYFRSIIAPTRLFSDLLIILPPVLATIALYCMRWWAVRPPRIWADQFGARR